MGVYLLAILAEQQLKQLISTRQGLNSQEAKFRFKRYGANCLKTKQQARNLRLFFAQFKSSIILISAALIVFVVSSSNPFFASRPGKLLAVATLTIVALTVALPYTPIAALIGFKPLSLSLPGLLGVIVALYLSTAEIAKHIF
jgi:magnesium-transporting ATPase (P-type)